MLNILEEECKKLNYKPRQVQIDAIKWLEKNWDTKNKCKVLSMPVGSGKSLISKTIVEYNSKMNLKSAIITPQNILLDQYLDEFDDIHFLKGKAHYTCEKAGTCDIGAELSALTNKKCVDCPYYESKKLVYLKNFTIFNPISYLYLPKHDPDDGECLYKIDTIVVDEFQTLTSMLRELMSLKLWSHDVKWEEGVTSSIPNVVELLEKYSISLDLYITNKNLEPKERTKFISLQKKIDAIVFYLSKYSQNYLCEETTDLYRKTKTKCLIIRPKFVPPHLSKKFFDITKRIVLMSGTALPLFYEELDFKTVDYIDLNSPIPKERRQIFIPSVTKINAKMEKEERASTLEMIAKQIKYISNILHPSEKGIILLPYSFAAELRLYLLDSEFLWMEKSNKKEKLEEFKSSKEKLVGVFSGCNEGISLENDISRFTIIPKVPYPNLMDTVVKARCNENKTAYALETMSIIIQASGRSCRSEKDFCATYILDSNFIKLYTSTLLQLPNYFRESLVFSWPKEIHQINFNEFRRQYEIESVT